MLALLHSNFDFLVLSFGAAFLSIVYQGSALAWACDKEKFYKVLVTFC